MANITEHYKNVFVHHWRTEDELTELEENPQFVYMMIPSEYVCVYHRLLVYLSDFGKELLSDCSAACRGTNKTVVDCWNVFQSAVACYNLGKLKEAETYIKYINAQLELIYKGTGNKVYDDNFIAPIDEEGHIKALVSCGQQTKFYIDFDNGKLLEQYEGKEKQVFTIDDENEPVVPDCYNVTYNIEIGLVYDNDKPITASEFAVFALLKNNTFSQVPGTGINLSPIKEGDIITKTGTNYMCVNDYVMPWFTIKENSRHIIGVSKVDVLDLDTGKESTYWFNMTDYSYKIKLDRTQTRYRLIYHIDDIIK